MTRVQILLDTKEISALRHQAGSTGKSYSQLVRDAIDTMYTSRYSALEIQSMARSAKRPETIKKFKDSKSFLKYIWSL